MLRYALLVALATAATTVLADPYTFILGAHAPVLTYTPTRTRDVSQNNTAAWNATYTDLIPGVILDRHGYPGRGDQIMWNTGAEGDSAPSVKYSFTGTAIVLRGYWAAPADAQSSASSVEFIVDGQSTTVKGVDGPADQLVTIANATLENGNHEVELIVRSGDVSLLFIDVTLDFPDIPLKTIQNLEREIVAQSVFDEEAYGIDNSPNIIFAERVQFENGTGDIINPHIQTVNGWLHLNNINNAIRYPNIKTNMRLATATTSLGSGNFFVRVNGSINAAHDQYSITITPAPPNLPSTITGYSWTYPWNGNGTIYMAALDPDVNYSFSLQNIGTWDVAEVDLHSIELWKGEKEPANAVNPSTGTGANNSNNTSNTPESGDNGKSSAGGSAAKASPPVGAIAGGIVGGVLALLLIGILVWFLLRRKRRARLATKEDLFEIEDNSHPSPQPYRDQSSQPTFIKGAPFEEVRSEPPDIYHEYEKPAAIAAPRLRPPTPPSSSGRSKAGIHPLKAAILSGSATGSSSSGPSSSSAYTSSSALNPTTLTRSQSADSFEQELDAGALQPEPAPKRRQIIPPSYDPSWASSREGPPSAAQQSVSSQGL